VSDKKDGSNNNEIIRIGDNGGNNTPSVPLDEFNESLEMQRTQIQETSSLLETQKQAMASMIKVIQQVTTDFKSLDESVKNTKKQNIEFYTKDKVQYSKYTTEDKLNRIKSKRDADTFQKEIDKIEKDRAKLAFGDFVKKAGEIPDKAVKAMLPYAKSPIKMFDLIPVAFGKVFGAIGGLINNAGKDWKTMKSTSRTAESSQGRMMSPAGGGMSNPFGDVGNIFEQMESGIESLEDTTVDGAKSSGYSSFLLNDFLLSPATTPLGAFFENLFSGLGIAGGTGGHVKPKSDLVMLAIIAAITLAIFALAPGLNFLIKTLAPVIADALALMVTIFTDLWTAFKPVLPIITALLQSLFGAILEIWEGIKGTLIVVLVKVLNTVLIIIGKLFDGIIWLMDFIPTLPKLIGDFIMRIKDWLFSLPNKIGAAIGDFFKGVGNFLGGAGKAAGDFVGGAVDNVKATAGKVWDGAVKFGKDIWTGFENLGIFKGIKAVLDIISGGITALFGAFDDIGFFLQKVGYKITHWGASDEDTRKGLIAEAEAKAQNKNADDMTRQIIKSYENKTTNNQSAQTTIVDNKKISYADIQPFALSPFFSM
jgi:hypothetical protein